VLVAVLMAAAVSTISAMRLDPRAVSAMMEDRRPNMHAAIPVPVSAPPRGPQRAAIVAGLAPWPDHGITLFTYTCTTCQPKESTYADQWQAVDRANR
jgi:hypothetical protein